MKRIHTVTVEFTFGIKSAWSEDDIKEILTSPGPVWTGFEASLADELDDGDSTQTLNAVWVEHATDDIKPGSVGELYEKEIGPLTEPEDRNHLGGMPVDSECGQDCAKAIASGKEMMKYVQAGFGEDFDLAMNLRYIVKRVCLVYICG